MIWDTQVIPYGTVDKPVALIVAANQIDQDGCLKEDGYNVFSEPVELPEGADRRLLRIIPILTYRGLMNLLEHPDEEEHQGR